MGQYKKLMHKEVMNSSLLLRFYSPPPPVYMSISFGEEILIIHFQDVLLDYIMGWNPTLGISQDYQNIIKVISKFC